MDQSTQNIFVHGFVDTYMLLRGSLDIHMDSDLPVRLAAKNGHVPLVKLLIEDGANPASHNNWALLEAIKAGHRKMVDLLLDDHRVTELLTDNLANDVNPLLAAIRVNNIHCVTKLLAFIKPKLEYVTANINNDVLTVLLSDSRIEITDEALIARIFGTNYNELVRVFLGKTANPACLDNLAIRWATQNNREDIAVALLRDNRVDPTVQNNISLKSAIGFGNAKIVGLILQYVRQNKPLEYPDAVKLVINEAYDKRLNGKSVMNILNSYIKSEVAIAATIYNLLSKLLSIGNISAAWILLPHVDPSVANNNALIIAASKGYYRFVAKLLEDVRVNPASNDNSALLNAMQNKHPRIVKLLLKDGRVDPSVGNNAILNSAIEQRNKTIVKLVLTDPRLKCKVSGEPARYGEYDREYTGDTLVSYLQKTMNTKDRYMLQTFVKHVPYKQSVKEKMLEKHRYSSSYCTGPFGYHTKGATIEEKMWKTISSM